jgi:hypothetical protein
MYVLCQFLLSSDVCIYGSRIQYKGETKMNYCAFEILSIIDECEGMDHPEMIPSPQKVRLDPEFAEALDWLIEQGFVEVCPSRHSSHHDESLAIECGFFHPGTDSLTITPSGTAALEEDAKHRVDLYSY